MSQHQHVQVRIPKIIQPHSRPLLWILFVITLFAILGVIGGYYFALKQNNGAIIIMGTDEQANQQIKSLLEKNKRLEVELSLIKTSQEINRIAVKEVRKQIDNEQGKQLSLQKKNALLNELVASGDAEDALQMMDFKLTKTTNKTVFQYALTVTHVKQAGNKITGNLTLFIEGQRDNAKTQLGMDIVTTNNISQIKLNFTHFQRIEGKIKLPKGFKASALIVKVVAKNHKVNSSKERYKWLIN